jgi:hypothetical protein
MMMTNKKRRRTQMRESSSGCDFLDLDFGVTEIKCDEREVV